jgi:hypothetical protein
MQTLQHRSRTNHDAGSEKTKRSMLTQSTDTDRDTSYGSSLSIQALQRQDKGKAIDTSTTPTTTRLGGQDRGLFITMHVAHKQGRKEQRAFNRKQSQHIHPSTSGVHAAIQQEAAVNRQPRRTRIPNSSHSTKRGT